jgi:hypothetical protein
MSGFDFNALDYTGNKPQVNSPGVYPAKLVSVKVQDIQDKEGNVRFEKTVQIEFDMGPAGTYTHTEFMPQGITAQSPFSSWEDKAVAKLSGVAQRIGHILKAYIPEEKLRFGPMPSKEFTWTDFLDKYSSVFAEVNTAAEAGELPTAYAKVSGSVYNGKSRLGFTAYLGFISANESDVRFSPKENESNNEWHQFQANKAAMSENPMGADLPGGGAAPEGLAFQGGTAPF